MKIPGRIYGGVPQSGNLQSGKRASESSRKSGTSAGSVQISPEARALDAGILAQGDEIREDLVAEAQELIASGELETDQNIDDALDRLFFDLF